MPGLTAARAIAVVIISAMQEIGGRLNNRAGWNDRIHSPRIIDLDPTAMPDRISAVPGYFGRAKATPRDRVNRRENGDVSLGQDPFRRHRTFLWLYWARIRGKEHSNPPRPEIFCIS